MVSDFVSYVRHHRRLIGGWFLMMLTIVLPVALFPHSGDLCTFLRVATAMDEGKTLYRDIVDIKPPLVYDIVRLYQNLGGDSEVMIHCIDALVLLSLLFIGSYLLYRVIGDAAIASISTWIMGVVYASTGYATVIQSESLAMFPLILLIWLHMREKPQPRLLHGFSIGVVCAVLTGLKVTLGSVLLVIAIVDIIEFKDGLSPLRVFIMKWVGIAVGFAGTSLLIWRVFMVPGAFDEYLQLMSFTRAYASIPNIDGVSIRFAWKIIATYYFDNYSIAFSLMALVGVRILYAGDARSRRLLRFLVLMFVAMLATVVMERKFFSYHFIRSIVPLAILSGYGFRRFVPWIREQWRQRNERLLLTIAVVLMIIWSPLARMMALMKPTVSFFSGREAFDTYYQNLNYVGMFRVEEQRIHDSIMAWKSPDDHVLVAALNSPRLALKCGDGGWSFIAGSQFALADYSSMEWRGRYADEMRRAQWLVVGLNDSNQYFNTPPKTSMQILNERDEFRGLLQRSFAPRWNTEHFVVFERSKAGVSPPSEPKHIH